MTEITLPSPDVLPAFPAKDATAPVEFPLGAVKRISFIRQDINSPPLATVVHASYRTLPDGTSQYGPFNGTETIPDLYAAIATPLVMPDGVKVVPPTPQETAAAFDVLTRWAVCRGVLYRAKV